MWTFFSSAATSILGTSGVFSPLQKNSLCSSAMQAYLHISRLWAKSPTSVLPIKSSDFFMDLLSSTKDHNTSRPSAPPLTLLNPPTLQSGATFHFPPLLNFAETIISHHSHLSSVTVIPATTSASCMSPRILFRAYRTNDGHPLFVYTTATL